MKSQITSLVFLLVFSFGINVAYAETASIFFDSSIKDNYQVGDTLSFKYEIEGDFSQNDKIQSLLIRQSDNKHFVFPSTNPQIGASNSGLISGEITRTSGYYLTDGLYDLEIRLIKASSGGKDGAIVDKDAVEICIGGQCDSDNGNISASITSISESPNPFVDGEAYNANKIGFSIAGSYGDKEYGSGLIDVNNNYWFHKVSTDLRKGNYELILYVDNKEYDREDFEVTSSSVSYSKNLKLSVKPDKMEEGDKMTIRFNDIGADYYIIGASCKDGVVVSDKSNRNACTKGITIYPTGKDVLQIDNMDISTDRDTSVMIEVSALENGRVIKTDGETVKVTSINKKVNNDNDKADTEPNNDNDSNDANLSKTQMLDLLSGMFGKNSDVYKIVSLLINLGIIK
jgi:hypothetical protein